jgi:hypothetical protein
MNDTTLSLGKDEEVEKPVSDRLKECAAICLASLDAWKNDQKDTEARENLMESVHELRKVASRIEIDIAMLERVNTNAKRIPIPEHKSKMEKKTDQKPLSEILPVAEIKKSLTKKKIEIQDTAESDDSSDDNSNENSSNSNNESEPKKRRPRRKKMDNTNQDD